MHSAFVVALPLGSCLFFFAVLSLDTRAVVESYAFPEGMASSLRHPGGTECPHLTICARNPFPFASSVPPFGGGEPLLENEVRSWGSSSLQHALPFFLPWTVHPLAGLASHAVHDLYYKTSLAFSPGEFVSLVPLPLPEALFCCQMTV